MHSAICSQRPSQAANNPAPATFPATWKGCKGAPLNACRHQFSAWIQMWFCNRVILAGTAPTCRTFLRKGLFSPGAKAHFLYLHHNTNRQIASRVSPKLAKAPYQKSLELCESLTQYKLWPGCHVKFISRVSILSKKERWSISIRRTNTHGSSKCHTHFMSVSIEVYWRGENTGIYVTAQGQATKAD